MGNLSLQPVVDGFKAVGNMVFVPVLNAVNSDFLKKSACAIGSFVRDTLAAAAGSIVGYKACEMLSKKCGKFSTISSLSNEELDQRTKNIDTARQRIVKIDPAKTAPANIKEESLKVIEDITAGYASEIALLQRQVKAAIDQSHTVGDLNQKNSELTKQIADLNNVIVQLQEEKKKLNDEQVTKSNENTVQKAEIEKLKKANETVKAKDDEIKKLILSAKTSEASIKDLTNKFNKAETDNKTTIENLNKKVKEFEDKFKVITQEKTDLETQAQTDTNNWTQEKNALQTEIDKLNKTIETLEKNLEASKTANKTT
ncbi:MAG: hypothetical protein L0207_06445 [Chlamydiae bacterium]|nr:hypothetical protein [Chlamydiota bacterium]